MKKTACIKGYSKIFPVLILVISTFSLVLCLGRPAEAYVSSADAPMNILAATGADQSEIDLKPVKNAGVEANNGTINSIINIAFSIAGGLALLFVAIGGFRYVISQGDPNATSQAKNTILYALIGLVVTILAYAIVRFVVRSTT